MILLRSVYAGAALALVLGLTLGLGSRAAAQPGARAAPSPFALDSWASLDTGPSLIRSAHPSAIDLAARDNESYITVYAKRRAVQSGPGAGRRVDGDEPGYSEAATPWTLPVVPPTNCANAAYQTIGGQPATGADLVGGLARGC